MRSYTVKENHIGSVVKNRSLGTNRDIKSQTYNYFYKRFHCPFKLVMIIYLIVDKYKQIR